MTDPDDGHAPASPRSLDPSVLARLAEDSSPEVAARFAARYAAMLQRRVDRILAAVATGDVDAAMDTVLSLKVSSSTIGTDELATLAATLEADVKALDWERARDRAAGLADAAQRAEGALAPHLPA